MIRDSYFLFLQVSNSNLLSEFVDHILKELFVQSVLTQVFGKQTQKMIDCQLYFNLYQITDHFLQKDKTQVTTACTKLYDRFASKVCVGVTRDSEPDRIVSFIMTQSEDVGQGSHLMIVFLLLCYIVLLMIKPINTICKSGTLKCMCQIYAEIIQFSYQ